MAESHDFDADRTSAPSCKFKLGGKWWHCRASVPFGFLRGLLDDQGPAEGVEALKSRMVQIERFFSAAIVPGESADFLAMLNDPSSPVGLPEVQPVIDFINEAMLKRPTERSSVSSPGPRKTTRTSKGASSSRATPRRASSA